MSNALKRRLKTADIIAGAIAVLLAIPGLELRTDPVERTVLVAVMVASLILGWRLARGRYWMVKIFLYAGIMLLATLVTRLVIYYVSTFF